MLKNIIFILLAVIVPAYSHAQFVDSAKPQPAEEAVVLAQNTENVVQTEAVVDSSTPEEEVDDEAARPVRITPEEVIALETESKKSIRQGLKSRSVDERKKMVGVLTWQKKKMKIKELMLEGKTYAEAKDIVEGTVKDPKVNVKNDREMENYMYKEGNLTSNEKQ